MGKGGPIHPISSIILAGGRSSRLGRNKALLELNGQVLIERIINRLEQVSDELIIVTNEVHQYEEFEANIISDVYPGRSSMCSCCATCRAWLLRTKW